MTKTILADEDLLKIADEVTVWIATPDAPRDMWSMREAIAWVSAQSNRDRITLFRPPGTNERSIWIKPDQIERLAIALSSSGAAAAAA